MRFLDVDFQGMALGLHSGYHNVVEYAEGKGRSEKAHRSPG